MTGISNLTFLQISQSRPEFDIIKIYQAWEYGAKPRRDNLEGEVLTVRGSHRPQNIDTSFTSLQARIVQKFDLVV